MKKLILLILVLAITGVSVFPVRAQKSRDGQKTREVTIFLLNELPTRTGAEPALVGVKRRVNAKAPLAGAIRSLLAGETEGEEASGFIFGLLFVSARIKNKTARIDFKYDRADLEEGEEFSWGATMRGFFAEAVERTALQFKGVERVLICVEGLSSYDSPDDAYHRKCPKNWAGK
jgi:hypothetical protein